MAYFLLPMPKISFSSKPVSHECFSAMLHRLHAEYLHADTDISRRQALRLLQGVIASAISGSIGAKSIAQEDEKQRNTVLLFDGEQSHITLPTLIYAGQQPITLEAIVQPATLSGERTIIGNHQGNGVCLRLKSGYFECLMHNGKQFLSARSDTKAETDVAVHIAGVCDGQAVRLYVNRQLQQTAATWSGTHKASPLPLMIGADPDIGGAAQHYFHGSIHKIRISGIARDRMPQWRKNPFGPTDRADAAYFDVENIQGDVLNDISRWRHHGQLHNVKVEKTTPDNEK